MDQNTLAPEPGPEKRKLIRKAFNAHQRVTDLIEHGLADEAKNFWREYMIKTAEVLTSTGQAGALVALDDA